ncbi:MAG: hypothetical protein A3G81_11200 [Betaproteobacteria bacterium RIFCSPLOWO2_12_FULL_65_14]|nr:MAG: hypothetical protein A3G81_11200 [Betaproteobacteria bacterium RIFCSPLOWO2_12_FULL_65_14]
MTNTATSPAASGPAGPHFEGQVGAYYLLAMLVGAEPLGLPRTTIARVALQRGTEGFPLDDVIVHAARGDGTSAVLEIQVKRAVTFAPADPVFKDVVEQIAAASRAPNFWTSCHELAIAIARTSKRIDGAYQDVLTWAREIGDSATFFARLARRGSASEEMRTFARTFQTNLELAGAATDDDTVWKLFRRLQILVFDFTAQGSMSEALARELATRALATNSSDQAGTLWSILVERSLQIAAAGGDRSRASLVAELQGLPLAGQRRYAASRAVISEASENAIADISTQVGGVVLGRVENVARIRNALEKSRYVEIRGDAGVGKSGLLKHLARQVGEQATVMVLSPGRTPSGGWTAMRSVLGFDGTAAELFGDLATEAGAVLFVDNLDLFPAPERRTVVDLIRAAAGSLVLSLVVTARRDFGKDEASWLPADAISRLGTAAVVTIDELSDSEVDELRTGSPQLAPLLAENHPARAIVRNLYRLGRLASRRVGDQMPRTEVDMADMWWQTGDGPSDSLQRERARLLREIGDAEIRSAGFLDARHVAAGVISAMVSTETIRDLGNDRIAFRHDVLREWSIGNLLFAEPERVTRLPLSQPATAIMARGIELAARIALERETSADGWHRLLSEVTGDGKHGSWRRAVMLALVRSEVATELLKRAKPFLFHDEATQLRELIRLVGAVDVRPAEQWFAAFGLDTKRLPPGLNIPYGTSWGHLIDWLLDLGDALPPNAIPEVADLYVGWSSGTFGLDPLTPRLLEPIYHWLDAIEIAHEEKSYTDRHEPFGVPIENLRTLESNLRTGFLLFCGRAPALAKKYLTDLRQRRYRDHAVRQVLKTSAAIAAAAPVELAELTAAELIASDDGDDDEFRRQELREPFQMLDHEFMPASPAQGSFFALLKSNPQVGLRLIRKLVDHAVKFYSRGKAPENNEIVIQFPSGRRSFPWTESYRWSRDAHGQYSLTSALMALEAWAHGRIEQGDSFAAVLQDVLGEPGAPTAYLLPAVDLVISHWPASRTDGIPLLACPELLSIDRERQTFDQMGEPDLLGIRDLHREPVGLVTLDSLKSRASRKHPLEHVLGNYAFSEHASDRDALRSLLTQEQQRLGPPDTTATFRDPKFMVLHALYLIDASNYRDVDVRLKDGTVATLKEYVSPKTEAEHLAALNNAAKPGQIDFAMQASVWQMVQDPSKSNPELLARVVLWARTPNPEGERNDESKLRPESILLAAMLAMKDGTAEFRQQNAHWAHSKFDEALSTKPDPVHVIRAGIRFNPISIALAGKVFALRDDRSESRLRVILETAALKGAASAYGFGYSLAALVDVDARLPRAVLRCGFAECIWERRTWDMDEKAREASEARTHDRLTLAVSTELEWLAQRRAAPSMPIPPNPAPRARRRLRFGRHGRIDPTEAQDAPQTSEEFNGQKASVWLSQLRGLPEGISRELFRDVMRAYSTWTFAANGSGLDDADEVDRIPMEWNSAYTDVVAVALPGTDFTEVTKLIFEPINSLPDEAALDFVGSFQRSIDTIYFGAGGLSASTAAQIRSALADRVMATSGWTRLADSRSTSFERHLASAIAVLFFNDYNWVGAPKSYLYPLGIDRIDPFLPILRRLIQGGASLFVAAVTLSLMEVAPKPRHTEFLVFAALRWLQSFPDHRQFWIEHSIGQRVCTWLDKIHAAAPTTFAPTASLRRDVNQLLAALVGLGVAEARRLEGKLSTC